MNNVIKKARTEQGHVNLENSSKDSIGKTMGNASELKINTLIDE